MTKKHFIFLILYELAEIIRSHITMKGGEFDTIFNEVMLVSAGARKVEVKLDSLFFQDVKILVEEIMDAISMSELLADKSYIDERLDNWQERCEDLERRKNILFSNHIIEN